MNNKRRAELNETHQTHQKQKAGCIPDFERQLVSKKPELRIGTGVRGMGGYPVHIMEKVLNSASLIILDPKSEYVNFGKN